MPFQPKGFHGSARSTTVGKRISPPLVAVFCIPPVLVHRIFCPRCWLQSEVQKQSTPYVRIISRLLDHFIGPSFRSQHNLTPLLQMRGDGC